MTDPERCRPMKSERATFDRILHKILKGNDDNNVVVSPMVWQPRGNGKYWYFVVSVSKGGEWFSISVEDSDYDPPGMLPEWAGAVDTVIQIRKADARSMLIAAMLEKPIVVHQFDTELESILCCERLWPGERITKVRKATELEAAS